MPSTKPTTAPTPRPPPPSSSTPTTHRGTPDAVHTANSKDTSEAIILEVEGNALAMRKRAGDLVLANPQEALWRDFIDACYEQVRKGELEEGVDPTVDAVRSHVARLGLGPSDPLVVRADLLEAWVLANLHLHDRAVVVAEAVLARPDVDEEVRRDAHLMLAKSLQGRSPERLLVHVRAAAELPRHRHASYRLRHWRLLLMALKSLDARADIDTLLDDIAADPELATWARIERVHEARRRGEPVELDPVLGHLDVVAGAAGLEAAAGLAFAHGRHAEGEAFLRGLLERNHDSPVLRCNLGWVLASQDRLDEVPPSSPPWPRPTPT